MKIALLSGWASDLRQTLPAFVPKIEETASIEIHSYPALMTGEAPIEADVLIAWSMGCHFIPTQKFKRIVLLNPALAFCHPEGGWAPRIVQRMAKRLSQDKKAVLSQFAKALGAEQSFTESWVQTACEMDLETLQKGLQQLELRNLETGTWHGEEVILIQGTKDEICSEELNLKLLNGATTKEISLPTGHEIFSELWTEAVLESLHV